ncbi:class I SAM-dependent methyltransferase [Panacagrimonas perspica]|uniref:class I SAM-dependent methyltransferase n=1 Tax=Panacagrimonas perspica TaxID=381431 RepID=UPI0013C3533D|nr:class I SAM-dependent methyltransferase [Panacagrimonas perspica]
MSGEFHDLSEAALNFESGGRTHWGNLGDWQHARSYPDACAALADRLASGLRLDGATRLVDVGFGCGDQILHWIRRYGVRHIAGLNLSHSQTELARRRVVDSGHPGIADGLQQGSVDALAEWAARTNQAPVDAIVALDCAYHFPSRRAFLRQAAQVLRPGGRIALSDLILARPGLPLHRRALLGVMGHFSRIPPENLVGRDDYLAQWRDAGLEVEAFEDITGHVFQPFGAWLERYRASLEPDVAHRIDWKKYRATAAFLRWADRQQVLRYVSCVGFKR